MKVYGFTIVFLFFSFFLGGLAEQCGRQAGNKKCPGGLCCSEFGYCGRTRPYCGKGCQSQCRVGGGNHSCAGDLDSLAANEQCGRQAGNRKCPRGLCCSEFGFCGSTRPYCGKGCQSQCKGGGAEDLDILAANEQCGRQAGNRKCPRGLCCSEFGFCGSTRPYCGKGCQSQCKGGGAEDLDMGLAANEQCGRQAGNKKCPRGLCCSQFGFCGSTRPYCGPGCQSQCKGGGGGPDSEDLKIEYVI